MVARDHRRVFGTATALIALVRCAESRGQSAADLRRAGIAAVRSDPVAEPELRPGSPQRRDDVILRSFGEEAALFDPTTQEFCR